MTAWWGYTDESCFVYAETDGEPHNTITPIARMRDGRFQLDLVLRNNITTPEHPLGVYHPHAKLHHIKKENIGLIEVMGLAVLPSRLKAEMADVDFYNAHPNDTLILVTAYHETGGMAIGYKTTNYDTFLTNLTHQKMSYAKFDSTYVKGYIANKTPFEAAMADVKANFGLTLPTDPDAASAGKLLLTDYEVENLRKAYERTLADGAASQKEMSQQDYEL